MFIKQKMTRSFILDEDPELEPQDTKLIVLMFWFGKQPDKNEKIVQKIMISGQLV